MPFDYAARSRGGQTSAVKQREAALQKYYAEPNRCKECLTVIRVNENQRIADAKKKQFCSRSCSALFNNRVRRENPRS